VKLEGRIIQPGKAEGEALVSSDPISFLEGINPETGQVTEKGHALEGEYIKDKILVFPHGRGSTVSSYAVYKMAKKGVGPKAIINAECETIVAVGCIISEIPCVDKIDITKIKTGDKVRIDGGTVVVS
jgi:predicted aconitase with swiveling domain